MKTPLSHKHHTNFAHDCGCVTDLNNFKHVISCECGATYHEGVISAFDGFDCYDCGKTILKKVGIDSYIGKVQSGRLQLVKVQRGGSIIDAACSIAKNVQDPDKKVVTVEVYKLPEDFKFQKVTLHQVWEEK